MLGISIDRSFVIMNREGWTDAWREGGRKRSQQQLQHSTTAVSNRPTQVAAIAGTTVYSGSCNHSDSANSCS